MSDSGDKRNPSGFGGQDSAGDASGSDGTIEDAQVAVSGKAADLSIVISSGNAARKARGVDGGTDDKDKK